MVRFGPHPLYSPLRSPSASSQPSVKSEAGYEAYSIHPWAPACCLDQQPDSTFWRTWKHLSPSEGMQLPSFPGKGSPP